MLLMLCDVFTSAAAVLFAVLSKLFHDKALRGEKGAFTVAAFMAATLLAQVLVRIFSGMLSEHIGGSLNMSLKNRIFGELMKKRYGDLAVYHSGELLNRMFSDTEVVCSAVTDIVPNAVSIVTRLLAVFAALAVFDLYLVAAALAVGILVFCVARLMRKMIKKRHREMQAAADKVRSFMQESTDRFLIIKIFGGAESVRKKALSLQKEHFKARLRRAFLSISTGGGFFFVFRAAYLGVLIYCAAAIGRGDGVMTVGTMTALLQLVSQIQQPFAALSGIMPKYYAAQASAERILELSDLPDEKALCSAEEAMELYEKADGIEVRGVSFDYGRGAVLKNASAYIPKGSFTLISGVTGAGKTTLFMSLLGIYRHEGSISIGDTPLDERTRRLFAYVPQGNLLFSGTVRDNLCLGGAYSDEDMEKALKTACAEDFVGEMPDGLSTEIGEHGHAVSEGQAQRLALARALLSDAPVLLLDEATSALDEETEKKLLANIRALENKTVLLISHKSAARELCDLEICLEKGALREIKK